MKLGLVDWRYISGTGDIANRELLKASADNREIGGTERWWFYKEDMERFEPDLLMIEEPPKGDRYPKYVTEYPCPKRYVKFQEEEE